MKRYLKAFSFSIILLLLGVLVLFGAEWQGSIGATLNYQKEVLLIAPVFLILMIFAHAKAMKDMSLGQYAIKLLGGNSNVQNRMVSLDYARVVGVILIIVTHACNSQLAEPAEAWKTQFLTVWSQLALVCNPLFIMMSGALLLSSTKKESIGKFYQNRFVKIFVPLALVYFVLLYQDGSVKLWSLISLKVALQSILYGALDVVTPHFWIIYILLGIYIIAPFIKIAVDRMTDAELNSLAIVIIVCEIVKTFGTLITGTSIGIALHFGSWTGIFILGYIFMFKSNDKLDRIIIAIGCAGVIITIITSLFWYNYTSLFTFDSPVSVFEAGALIVLFRKMEDKLKRLPNKLVTALSVNSYMMILLHWYVMYYVTYTKCQVQPLRFGCVGGLALTTLITLLTSYVLAIICDNTLCISVKYLLTFDLFRTKKK